MAIKTIALIVAAGGSTRMNGGIPKPYMDFAGKTIIARTVEIFLSHPRIDAVRVVIKREHNPLYKKATFGLPIFPMVVGGETRQESVKRGLESLRHINPHYVLVHDAARPLTSHALIDRVLDGLDKHEGVIPTLPVPDTIKQIESGLVKSTLPREGLHRVQTPQGFAYAPLLAAHEKLAELSLTDDAAVMEQCGHKIAAVEGEVGNFKITTQEDLRQFMQAVEIGFETRTGLGFDVHALMTHDEDTPSSQHYIKLCGVKIPHTHYLKGHSDADVGLHAIVDAMLGAICEGDIGTHFPPDDHKWKGADSERFLMHAYELIKMRGGDVQHIDVTLICERPLIKPHVATMRHHMASLLKLAEDRISVKATTTEKLGFTGRGEGIAAQAIATIKLPRTA